MNSELSAPEMAESVVRQLRQRDWTVATAESLTGGLICAALTQPPGASNAVTGGLIVYTVAAKSQLLGLDEQDLSHHGVYSEWTALAMAKAAARVTAADVAVACTGVAGPGPDDGVAAGSVWIAVQTPTESAVRLFDIPGDRESVRMATVHHALALMLELLERP